MNESFISYSHKDRDLVNRLLESLRKQGIDPWYDSEDIKPAIEWRSEVRVGIQACHNFIFCISPNSVASVECLFEIEVALSHNKRIIPILISVTENQDIPDCVRDINWISFLHFEDGLVSLLKILESPFGVGFSEGRIDSLISIKTGSSEPRIFYLYRNLYLIARNPKGHISKHGLIAVNDRYVSRNKHAWLSYQNGRWYAADAGSTNGIFVNGKRIKQNHQRPLLNKDTITLSSFTSIFYREVLNDEDHEDIDERDTLTSCDVPQ